MPQPRRSSARRKARARARSSPASSRRQSACRYRISRPAMHRSRAEPAPAGSLPWSSNQPSRSRQPALCRAVRSSQGESLGSRAAHRLSDELVVQGSWSASGGPRSPPRAPNRSSAITPPHPRLTASNRRRRVSGPSVSSATTAAAHSQKSGDEQPAISSRYEAQVQLGPSLQRSVRIPISKRSRATASPLHTRW